MPKCQCDDELRNRALLFVEQHGGSPAVASNLLKMNRVKFWRFLKTGSALARTRAQISRGMDAAQVEAGDAAIKTKQKVDAFEAVSMTFTAEDARMIRAFCHKVIAAVDLFESTKVTRRPDEMGYVAGRG